MAALLARELAAGWATGRELWYYHGDILRECERLGQADELPYNVRAIAGNLRRPVVDVDRWVDDLIAAGLLREAAPRWECSSRWVDLP